MAVRKGPRRPSRPFRDLNSRRSCRLFKTPSDAWILNKLADFKADVRQAQDDAAAKAVSRVQHEKSYPYKKKSHEEQARFNNEVEQCIHEAQEGMAVVAEYMADELADDSDDEKRLEKAEKAAERKAGLKKRKRALQPKQATCPFSKTGEAVWVQLPPSTVEAAADCSHCICCRREACAYTSSTRGGPMLCMRRDGTSPE